MKYDCIVLGGGVVGMTTARELALQGLSVSLFDKGKLGQEASWAAGGILSSMRPWSEDSYSSELSSQGKACYEDFVFDLKQQTGIDSEYFQSGMLMINQCDVGQARQWAIKHRISFHDTYDEYPKSMRLQTESIFLPEIAQVRVPALLKALYTSLLKLKVTIYEDTEVTKLDSTHNRFNAVLVGSERYCADNIIVTAGAWSEQILDTTNDDIAIKPVLGQMLCVKFAEQQLQTMVLDGGHYFIPRKDGHVLIGSTMEDVGFVKGTTRSARHTLMEWATTLWPDISNAEFIKQWSGLRPATNNGKPYLGKLKDYENVYINAGHFRKGILQAPVCARKIAKLLCR